MTRDAGHEPESLGLGERELEARAGRVLSDAVERFRREEREAHELGRLEARMVLACALRDAAAARLQRFTDHAYFHEWSYETLDGRGSTSLTEEPNPAALLVAHDAEQHVVRSINEVTTRLVDAEAPGRTLVDWQAEDKTSGKTSGFGRLKRDGRSMISSGNSVPIQRALTHRPFISQVTFQFRVRERTDIKAAPEQVLSPVHTR